MEEFEDEDELMFQKCNPRQVSADAGELIEAEKALDLAINRADRCLKHPLYEMEESHTVSYAPNIAHICRLMSNVQRIMFS